MRKIHDNYVTQDLWEVLRNGLLHNYSTKHNRGTNPVRYALIKNDKELHLTAVPDKSGYLYFNVQSFIDHMDQAANLFLDELETENSDAQTNSMQWIATHEAFTVFPQVYSDHNGILLVDMASAVVPPAESSVQFSNIVAYTKVTDKHRIFESPKWQGRDRNRSRGGNTLR